MKRILAGFLFAVSLFAQAPDFSKMQGWFWSIGVSPRFPVGDFSDYHNPGAGFDCEISYSDTEIQPVFVYLKGSYTHFPGRQSGYKGSQFASVSSNLLSANIGLKYFFPPIAEVFVLLMPHIEVEYSAGFFNTQYVYKSISSSPSEEAVFYNGGAAAFGISAFIADVSARYNYYYGRSFISGEIKLRLPIYISL